MDVGRHVWIPLLLLLRWVQYAVAQTTVPTKEPTKSASPTSQPSLLNATGEAELGFFDDERNVLIVLISGSAGAGLLLMVIVFMFIRGRMKRRRPRIVQADVEKLKNQPSDIFGVESIETSVRESRRNSYYINKHRWSSGTFFRSFRKDKGRTRARARSSGSLPPMPPPKYPRSRTLDSESTRGQGILRQMSTATTESTFSEEESASQAPRYTRKFTMPMPGFLRRNFSLSSDEY